MVQSPGLARLGALLLLLSASSVGAADATPVARVGKATISAEALTARLAELPDFQRSALGTTPDRLKRRVLEDELIPELLFAQEAEHLKVAERPEFKNRERELLRGAMERELRAQVRAPSAEEIRAYFEANRGRFETPRRLRLWRIVVDDEALAKQIIREAQGTDALARWDKFARDNSLDKATHLRNGDLGFVRPDGNTDTPTLRVDAALFAAADKIADGELCPEPIKEASHFAVVWRRGSLKAIHRTLAQEEGAIAQVLERERLGQAQATLLAALRAKYLHSMNEAALENVHFDLEGLAGRANAAPSTHPAAAGSSIPQPTERGER